MKGFALFIVLIAAKLAAIWPHDVPAWSPWSLVAFAWQEALIGLGLAALEGLTHSRWRMSAWIPAVMSVAYWATVVWAAINIPVGRVLGTPLTVPMLQATGGALADSLRLHVTPVNLLLMTGTIASAALLPRVLSRLGRTPRRGILFAALALSAIGPWSVPHAAANGVDRSGVVAFAESLGSHVTAAGDKRDWRHSPFPVGVSAATDDLGALHGAARGRNVVIVSLESTAAQYLSVYGGRDDVTPTLTALSRTGLVFEHAYAAYPESIKGLFSILCSTFPAFDVNVHTLSATACDPVPSVLHRQGYRTALRYRLKSSRLPKIPGDDVSYG